MSRFSSVEGQKKKQSIRKMLLLPKEEEEGKSEWAFDIKQSHTGEDGNTWTSISDTRGIWSSSAQPADKSSGVRTDSVVLPEPNCTITIFSEDTPALRVSMDGSINKVSLKEERSIEFRDSADEETSTLYLHDTFSESQGAQKRSPFREEGVADEEKEEIDNARDDPGFSSYDECEDLLTPEVQKTKQADIEPEELDSVGDCDTFETLEDKTLEEASLKDDAQSMAKTNTLLTMEDETVGDSFTGCSTSHALSMVELQKKAVMGQLQQLIEFLLTGSVFDYVFDRAEKAAGLSEYLDKDGNIPKEDKEQSVKERNKSQEKLVEKPMLERPESNGLIEKSVDDLEPSKTVEDEKGAREPSKTLQRRRWNIFTRKEQKEAIFENKVGNPELGEASSVMVTTESRGQRMLKFLKGKKSKFSRKTKKKVSN